MQGEKLNFDYNFAKPQKRGETKKNRFYYDKQNLLVFFNFNHCIKYE